MYNISSSKSIRIFIHLLNQHWLFGSYAKQEATKESDVDLIIDTNSKLKGFALLKLICQIEERLQKNIDGFEKYEIIENSLIDKEIKETGIVVYENKE